MPLTKPIRCHLLLKFQWYCLELLQKIIYTDPQKKHYTCSEFAVLTDTVCDTEKQKNGLLPKQKQNSYILPNMHGRALIDVIKQQTLILVQLLVAKLKYLSRYAHTPQQKKVMETVHLLFYVKFIAM